MSNKINNQLLIIFGASGDLTARKLIPAVYNLYVRGFLPENFAVVGVSRTKFSDEEFRNKVVNDNEHLKKKVKEGADLVDFASKMYYQPIDTSDASDYAKLVDRLKGLDKELGTGDNFTFYLSSIHVEMRLNFQVP